MYIFYAALSLKTTSATRWYINLDIPEGRNLIDKHSRAESVPKIIHMLKRMQGTLAK
jgi:hypothetical protein